MSASIDQQVLPSFRVDGESFRYLDSILRRRCSEINENFSIRYDVLQKNTFNDSFDSIEDVINERNGSETLLQSVKIVAKGNNSENFNFTVSFSGSLRISGECEDRAKFFLLISDIKNLINEKMKDRVLKKSTRGKIALAGFIVGIIGYFIFSLVATAHYNHLADVAANKSYQADQIKGTSQENYEKSFLKMLSAAVKRHDTKSEIDFLAQQQVDQINSELASSNSQDDNGNYYMFLNPWWATSKYLYLASAVAFSIIALALSYIFFPSSGATFVIGYEIERQKRLTQVREKLIWGVGVALFIAVVAPIIVDAIVHA